MSTKSPSYHNYIYTTIVIFGFVVCFSSVYIASTKVDHYAHNTNRIHRLITSSEMELDTLDKEANEIESTITEFKSQISNEPEKHKKLTKEYLRLNQNIQNLRTDIAEKQKLLITLNLLRTSTLSEIKTLFWINSSILVLGSLMVILGVSALVFKLEVFEERRNKRRQENTTSD